MAKAPAGSDDLLTQVTALRVGSVAGPPEKPVPAAAPESSPVLMDEQSALARLHPNRVLDMLRPLELPISAYINVPPPLTKLENAARDADVVPDITLPASCSGTSTYPRRPASALSIVDRLVCCCGALADARAKTLSVLLPSSDTSM